MPPHTLPVNTLMTIEPFNSTAAQQETPQATPASSSSQPDVQYLGAFPQAFPQEYEGVLLSLLPSALPLKQRWRTNGLSADFLADYLLSFLPGDEESPETRVKHKQVHSAVSYIANELLENAMKFSNPGSSQPITVELQLWGEQLLLLVSNSSTVAGMQKYQSFIEEAMAGEPAELLLQRLEQSEQEQEQGSGLGLVTILSDYPAKLGWQFERVPQQPEVVLVTTAVLLSI